MSKREVRNPATQQFTKIDDILNIPKNNNNKIDSDIDINVDVNNEAKELDNINTDVEIDRIAALKAKMQASKKKDSNKQVTVYLTPKNYKRFNQLKEKGQKSELVNQLLDMYFEE